MSTAASFRARLTAREPLFGAWSVIPSPLSVRPLAAAGFDYVVIDLQHGGATETDLPAMTSAIRLAGATPVGRIRHAHPADIGRSLYVGCEGFIVPNVESAAQAREVAGAVRYPPAGYRSAGGVLAAADPFCVVMVESAAALQGLGATPGVGGRGVGRGLKGIWARRPPRRKAGRGARHRRRHRPPVPRRRLHHPDHGQRRHRDHQGSRRAAGRGPFMTMVTLAAPVAEA